MAGQTVQPIVIQGDYRADAAFRALGRDLNTARTSLAFARTEMTSMSAGADMLGRRAIALGNNTALLGRRNGALGGSFTQLSFQINDIASGLLMGQSPFQIMAQQGGQVFQVWQMNNNVFKELKDKIVGLITPGRAVILGFTAAAGAAYLLYRAVNDNGPTAEQTLKEQGRLIGLVKEAYRDATKAAGEFHKEGQSALLLQAKQNLLELRSGLASAGRDFMRGVTEPTSVPSETGIDEPAVTATRHYRDFASAIDNFNASIANGAPDLETFRNQVSAIGLANPALQKTGVELLKAAERSGEFADKIKGAVAQVNLLSGKGTKADRDALGLSSPAAKRSLQDLIDKTRDQVAEYKLEAVSAGLAGRAVEALKLQHDFERAAKRDGISVDAAKRKSLDELTASYIKAKDAVAAANLAANIKFDREQLGRTPGEAAIAETLRSAKLDVNSGQGEFLAGQLRVNQSLTETRDLSRDALKGFISDMRAGKSAGDAFANVLNRIADKLIDMGVNNLAASAFGGGGGFLSSLFGGANLNLGNAGGTAGILPPIHHGGYGPGDTIGARRLVGASSFNGAPRYHSGIGPGERPAIIRDDESVLTPGQMRALGARASGSGKIEFHLHEAPGVTTTTKESRTGGGGRRLDVYQTMKAAAVDAVGSGDTDAALRGRHGLGRQLVNR